MILRDTGWRGHLAALTIVTLAIMAVFASDVATMAMIWWGTSTFNHCLLILPIIAWLIYQRRDEVVGLVPRVWLPGLVLVFVAICLWVLGEAADFNLARQAAIIFLVQASAVTLLGPAVARGLMFPLFYLVFLIPFGEELVAPLQTITAKICTVLLGFSGIPAHVDGVFITTANGYYQVAEACSGVKFLIAMVAYATLVANVCFRSWPRRIIFVVMAATVSILANGVRAFGTIYIGWLTDTNFAASFDHIVYGWFFFALVMGTVMLVGWRFFDRGVGDLWLNKNLAETGEPAPSRTPWTAAAAVLLVVLIPVGLQSAVAASGRMPVGHIVTMPEVKGWTRINMDQRIPWAPRFDGADHQLLARFSNAQGDKVDLALVIYGWQGNDRKIIGYAHGAVDPDSKWRWTADLPSTLESRAEKLLAPGPVARIVASTYIIDGRAMASPAQIKLATLKSRLLGGDQAAVGILVSAEESETHPAAKAIARFRTDMGPMTPFAARLVAQARGQ
jgi:exosortase A